MTNNAKKIITNLFDFYLKNPNHLPNNFNQQNLAEIICNYIAGMTDRFAYQKYHEFI